MQAVFEAGGAVVNFSKSFGGFQMTDYVAST
jgi:hypothetical protein